MPKKIIVIGMDPNPKIDKPYTSPLNGIPYYVPNQKGNYFIADIVDRTSIQLVKSNFVKGVRHAKFAEMVDHESHFGIDSTFSTRNIGLNLSHDPRLIIQFDSEKVTINSFKQPFVGLSNPAFYIP